MVPHKPYWCICVEILGIQVSEGLVLVLNIITILLLFFVAPLSEGDKLKKRKEEEELNSVAAEEDVSSEPTPSYERCVIVWISWIVLSS